MSRGPTPIGALTASRSVRQTFRQKIGLFSNRKRAAQLTLSAFERELLEKFPTAQTSWYACSTINTPEMLTEGKAKFEAWVSSLDAVVLSVAD